MQRPREQYMSDLELSSSVPRSYGHVRSLQPEDNHWKERYGLQVYWSNARVAHQTRPKAAPHLRTNNGGISRYAKLFSLLSAFQGHG